MDDVSVTIVIDKTLYYDVIPYMSCLGYLISEEDNKSESLVVQKQQRVRCEILAKSENHGKSEMFLLKLL